MVYINEDSFKYLENIIEKYTRYLSFRISIESASKVWNACGLRIGGIITDNHEFHTKSISEYTANLCANNIGQYIFGALALESKSQIKKWYSNQNSYY